jgi:hypothetical protein
LNYNSGLLSFHRPKKLASKPLRKTLLNLSVGVERTGRIKYQLRDLPFSRGARTEAEGEIPEFLVLLVMLRSGLGLVLRLAVVVGL